MKIRSCLRDSCEFLEDLSRFSLLGKPVFSAVGLAKGNRNTLLTMRVTCTNYRLSKGTGIPYNHSDRRLNLRAIKDVPSTSATIRPATKVYKPSGPMKLRGDTSRVLAHMVLEGLRANGGELDLLFT